MAADRRRSSRTGRARAARRRKRRMDRVEHDLSDAQWIALKREWGGCAYCGTPETPLQRDCVLALSRGGRYTLANVVPACRSCNTSKCNHEVSAWLRRKRLDERTFLLRLLDIVATVTLEFSAASNVAPPTQDPPSPPLKAEAQPTTRRKTRAHLHGGTAGSVDSRQQGGHASG